MVHKLTESGDGSLLGSLDVMQSTCIIIHGGKFSCGDAKLVKHNATLNDDADIFVVSRLRLL